MIDYSKSSLAVALLFIANASMATIFQYEDLNANNGGFADRLSTVSGTFNDVTERFTWDVTFNTDPTDVDGFWLVVNNGLNPKQSNVNELAIIYGDMSTGVMSTYVYNGQNNANSIVDPGILLQTDSFSTTSDSFGIDIDATAINAWSTSPYTGISFGEKIGIWFHIATGSNFSYNGGDPARIPPANLGDIIDFGFASQGWYDKNDRDTTTVPEPDSIALFAVGLIGLGLIRRRAKIG